jgi:hypothetical protein
MEDENNYDDKAGVHIFGHLLIRDADTGEILVDQRDDLLFQKHNLGNTDAG